MLSSSAGPQPCGGSADEDRSHGVAESLAGPASLHTSSATSSGERRSHSRASPRVQAFSLTLVRHEERAAFEAAARQEGLAEFQITERSGPTKIRPTTR